MCAALCDLRVASGLIVPIQHLDPPPFLKIGPNFLPGFQPIKNFLRRLLAHPETQHHPGGGGVQGGGSTRPLPPRPPPPQTKVTIVGRNESHNWENLVGSFLVHKLLDPRPPLPLFYYFPGPGPGTRTLESLPCPQAKTIEKHGCSAVYQGLTISLYGIFVYRGVYFGLYDTAKVCGRAKEGPSPPALPVPCACAPALCCAEPNRDLQLLCKMGRRAGGGHDGRLCVLPLRHGAAAHDGAGVLPPMDPSDRPSCPGAACCVMCVSFQAAFWVLCRVSCGRWGLCVVCCGGGRRCRVLSIACGLSYSQSPPPPVLGTRFPRIGPKREPESMEFWQASVELCSISVNRQFSWQQGVAVDFNALNAPQQARLQERHPEKPTVRKWVHNNQKEGVLGPVHCTPHPSALSYAGLSQPSWGQ